MPYELTFTKALSVRDDGRYINPCCFGGDFVVERLLPALEERYESLQVDQEDWGWFIWFRAGKVRLAVDVFCDEPEAGAFRVLLTSRVKRWGLFDRISDTPELEVLRDAVEERLEGWSEGEVSTARLDDRYGSLEPGGPGS